MYVRSGDLPDGRVLLGNILENERTEGVTVEQNRKALPGEPVTSEGSHIALGVGDPVGERNEEDVREFNPVTGIFHGVIQVICG